MAENNKKENKIVTDENPLTYSLFLGCVIPNRYPMIEKASRTFFDHVGVVIKEMEGASCCPAPGVFRSVDKAMWHSVSARNVCIAQDNNTDLLTLCNGCYGTLLEVSNGLKQDAELKDRVNEILNKVGYNFDGSNDVRHIMDVLINDIGVEKLQSYIKKKFGWKIAIHYGCHLIKPSVSKPFGGNVDSPRFFDDLVEAMGFESLDYEDKMLCCGAGGAVRTIFKEESSKFTLTKLRSIRRSGADCIVVCCPFCQLQLDLGQLEVKPFMEEGEEPFAIPVLYITQLIGLAFGIDPKDLGMIKPDLKGISPFISQDPILKKLEEFNAKEKEDAKK